MERLSLAALNAFISPPKGVHGFHAAAAEEHQAVGPVPAGEDDERLVSVGLVAPIMPQEFMLGNSYYVWKETQKPFEAFTSWSGMNLCDLSEANPAHLACACVPQGRTGPDP